MSLMVVIQTAILAASSAMEYSHSGRLSRAGRERIFNSDNNTLLWENKPHRNPPTEFKNLKVPTDNGEDRLGSVHTIWNAQPETTGPNRATSTWVPEENLQSEVGWNGGGMGEYTSVGGDGEYYGDYVEEDQMDPGFWEDNSNSEGWRLKDGSLLPSRLVDAIYEAFLALHTGNDPDAVVSEVLAKVEEDGAEDRLLNVDINSITSLANSIDFSSLAGLFNFLTSQLDVVTVVGLVKTLENRASYDPRFRESFPDFLKNNAWFMPPKKYKLIPRTIKRNGGGKVIWIANKHLHNYNLQNNPHYQAHGHQGHGGYNHNQGPHPSHHAPHGGGQGHYGGGGGHLPHRGSGFGSGGYNQGHGSEEGGGFGPDFTKDFFESTHLNKGFFDENFPGNAADLSFKDHSFSNHGKRHARPAQYFQGHRHGGQNGVIPFQNNGIGNGQRPNQNFNPEYETEYDEDEVDYPAPEVDYPYQGEVPGSNQQIIGHPHQAQGGTLNRGPLLNDLVYRQPGSRFNRPGFNGGPNHHGNPNGIPFNNNNNGFPFNNNNNNGISFNNNGPLFPGNGGGQRFPNNPRGGRNNFYGNRAPNILGNNNGGGGLLLGNNGGGRLLAGGAQPGNGFGRPVKFLPIRKVNDGGFLGLGKIRLRL